MEDVVDQTPPVMGAGKPSFYEVLGVQRESDAASIRSAYIALMKQYHPDALRGVGPDAEVRSKEINLAFATLRDPKRRRRYDAELVRIDALSRIGHSAAGENRRPRQPARPSAGIFVERRATRGRSRAPRWLFLALLMLGTAVFTIFDFEQRFERAAVQQPLPGEAFTRRIPTQPAIHLGDVRDAVDDLAWIAAHGGVVDAENYSRNCFIELEESPNFRMLDHCIAFDLASYHWAASRRARNEASGNYFFRDGIDKRRAGALGITTLSDLQKRSRMNSLERVTISEIARALRMGFD